MEVSYMSNFFGGVLSHGVPPWLIDFNGIFHYKSAIKGYNSIVRNLQIIKLHTDITNSWIINCYSWYVAIIYYLNIILTITSIINYDIAVGTMWGPQSIAFSWFILTTISRLGYVSYNHG